MIELLSRVALTAKKASANFEEHCSAFFGLLVTHACMKLGTAFDVDISYRLDQGGNYGRKQAGWPVGRSCMSSESLSGGRHHSSRSQRCGDDP